MVKQVSNTDAGSQPPSNPSCKWLTYVPEGCTPASCSDTLAFCKRLFPDDVAECVQYQSSSPNKLLAAAPTIQSAAEQCCGETPERGCFQTMESQCYYDPGDDQAFLVGTSGSCVQKDRNATDAGCGALGTQSACTSNPLCEWEGGTFNVTSCTATRT